MHAKCLLTEDSAIVPFVQEDAETKDPRLSISVLTSMLGGLISCQLLLIFLIPALMRDATSPGAFIVDLGALEAELG